MDSGEERCPTCGQAVAVHTGSEGTSSYVKVADDVTDNYMVAVSRLKAERDSLQAQLERTQYVRDHLFDELESVCAQLDEAREDERRRVVQELREEAKQRSRGGVRQPIGGAADFSGAADLVEHLKPVPDDSLSPPSEGT